jgi:hypothetical protein
MSHRMCRRYEPVTFPTMMAQRAALGKRRSLGECERLERSSILHHHLNSLEHSKMVVALRVRMSEGGCRVCPESDFGRLAAK